MISEIIETKKDLNNNQLSKCARENGKVARSDWVNKGLMGDTV
jgi:hypothetical protein